MSEQYEIEVYKAHENAWALYGTASTMAGVKSKIESMVKDGLSEEDIRVEHVVRNEVDFQFDCADQLIAMYRNFCARSKSCSECEYGGEEDSVACLKRFISEWERKEK